MTQYDILLQASGLPGWVQDPVSGFIALLPRLVGAIVILLIGWVIGRGAAAVVRRIADRIELDRMVLDTPLGRMLGGTESAVSGAFGKLAAWFIYALAILAAANVLAISTLSLWVSTAVSYLPALIAGLLVIVLGFVVADFIGDAIMRTRAATTPTTRRGSPRVPGCSCTSPPSSSASIRWESTWASSTSSLAPSRGASPPPSPSVPVWRSVGADGTTSPSTSTAG
nr:hypothetical protein [Haladaptatus sp. R4]